MKTFFLFLFLFFHSFLFAQKTTIDSLENELKRETLHDTVRMKVLSRVGWYYTERDFEKSNRLANEILALSKPANNHLRTADAYNLLGFNADAQSKPIKEVVDFYNKALLYFDKLEDKKPKANVLNNIGLAYRRVGNHDKAFSFNLKALNLAKNLKDTTTIINTLNNMAIIFTERDDSKKAKAYYFKSLKYAENANNKRMTSTINNNLANVYLADNQVDSAILLFKRALTIAKEVGNEFRIVLPLANLGKAYIKKEQYELGNDYLDQAYQLSEKLDYPYGKGLCLYYLTRGAAQQKRFVAATNYAKQGLELLGSDGELYLQASYYKILSDSYDSLHNYTLAYENLKNYQIIQDSLYNLDKEQQINELETQYQVKQKETENELLKVEKKANKKTIQNQNITAIALFLGLLLVGTWGIFVFRSNQQKKKYNKELEKMVAKRTAELEQANIELRTFNYIASHDIKEPIRVISGYAGLIFKKLPTDLKENLAEYFDTIKRSTAQLYTLIEDFANYTTMSKNEKIETQAVDLNLLMTNIVDNLYETTQKYKGTVEIKDLPMIESSNSLLFTALKNLIENGLKYNQSEKPTVTVSYQKNKNTHEIIVSDNGIGIDEKYHEKIFEMFKRLHNRGEYEGSGIGLAIVKLTIEKLNGKVLVESQEGQGSRFIVKLPIE